MVSEFLEDEPIALELQWLFEDSANPETAKGRADRLADSRFTDFAEEVRGLPQPKRRFLRFLLANQLHPQRALRAMNTALGTDMRATLIARWLKDPAYASLVERYSRLVAETAGAVSPTSIILRTDEAVEQALRPEDGQERDLTAGLKGLAMLAKFAGIYDSEKNEKRMTVILDFSDAHAPEQQDEQLEELSDGDFQNLGIS